MVNALKFFIMFFVLVGAVNAAQLIAVPQGGSSSGYGLNNATTPAGNWWVGGNTFNYTGGTGTYNVTSLTVRTFRGSTSATTNTSAIISYTNSTNGCTGFNTTSQMIATGYTGNYNLNTTHGNHTITLTTPATLNDSQSYCLMFGGDSGELGRLELQTTSTVGQWHYAGGSPPLIPYQSYNVVFALYGEVNSASSSMFSITAKNNDTAAALTNFSANVTYGGLTINYNTSNGTIYTNITASSGNANVTVYATNYFSNSTTNFNTSANLDMPLIPYSVVLASDRFNYSSILSFNVQYSGVNYSSNTSTGLAYVPATTTPYTLTVTATDYLPLTFYNATRTTTYNASIFQAQANFNAEEIFTSNSVTNFTMTYGSISDTGTSPTLYLRAGSYNVTFSKTGWYPLTYSFTIAATENTTETITNVYQYLANITLNDYITNATVSTFTANLTGATYTAEETTTNGTLYIPWIYETDVNITANVTDSYSDTTELHNITDYLTNISLSGYPFPSSVSVYIYDQNGDTITDNITITVTGNSTEETYNTVSSYYYVPNLTAQVYTFKFSGDNYTLQSYLLTVGTLTHQELNVYLTSNSNNVTFTIRDKGSNALVDSATITQQRIINSSWVTVSSRYSDITGRAQFQYVNDVAYRFYVTKSGYTDKSFILDPVLAYLGIAAYQVEIEQTNAVDDSTQFAGISYTLSPSRYYDDTINNLSFQISSPYGALESYGVIAYFTGSNNPQSTQDTNAYGSTLTLSLNISGAALQDTVNITFWYDTTLTNNLSFTRTYFIQGSPASGTIYDLRNTDFGFTPFEKAFIATMAIVLIGASGFMFGGMIGGLFLGVITMGWFFYLGFLNIWAILPAVLAAFLIMAFKGGSN